QWRRTSHGLAVARGTRGVRARVSGGADQSLRRQYFPYGGVCRHGTLGSAPQAQGLEHQLAHFSAQRIMSRIAYVNGRYVAAHAAMVHVEDRGYQFSDGVYEVCEVRGGRLIDERRHMARLQRSLRELRMAQPMSLTALGVVLRETVRRNRVSDGIVYLQVTRGVARRDHAFPAPDTPPGVVVTARSLNAA